MWLLFVEAAVAFLILAFIVYWTMFAGRKPPKDKLGQKGKE
jgi:hypothetical protein